MNPVPKCKDCSFKIKSGNRSYCSQLAAKTKIGVHITTKEQHPSPSWCPLRKEVAHEQS